MTQFLNKEQLNKMDGQNVAFVVATNIYAAKVAVSTSGIYLCQTRLNGGAECPDKKGQRSVWFVPFSQLQDYFIFQDNDVLPKLIEIDKEAAEFACKSEQTMADFDKRSKMIGREVLLETLECKRKVVEESLRKIQTEADHSITTDGILSDLQKNCEAAATRAENAINAWEINNTNNKGE